jgi:hypothetical protein
VRRGIGSGARRWVGVGLGAGVCLAVGALPARAATLGPVTVPSVPPLEVATGPVTVGPVTIDPRASVTPAGAEVDVATGGLPLADGGPDLGLTVGSDGAQVGVGGIDAGVGLSPPPALAPLVPGAPGGVAPSQIPAAATAQRSASNPAGSSSPDRTRAVAPSTASDPKVVALANRARVSVSGGLDAPAHRNWWSLATGAARSYFLWIVLLLAAFVIRNRVGAAWRDQRGVKLARSD